MRSITAAQAAVLLRPKYQVASRVRVDDGTGTFWDLSTAAGQDWILSIEIDENIDTPVSTAKVIFERESYFLSLSPMIAVSKLNNLGGSLRPLLQTGREIKIETATIPLGAVPQTGDWVLQWDGYIDLADWGPDFKLTVNCRDQGEALQDTVAKIDRGYCGVGVNADASAWNPSAPASAETVIQQIISDNLVWTSPTLYTPTSPGWTVYGAFATASQPAGFKVEKGSNVLDAIQNIAAQIGWDIRYLWDTASGTFKLTFWSPPRSGAVSSHTFNKDQILGWQKMTQDATQVRNVIEVDYPNPAITQPDGVTPANASVIVSDSASIVKYHQRFMAIQSAASAQLDTLALATSLGNAILSDLKEPLLDSMAEVPFFFAAVLGDYYTFTADQIHFDTDQSLGVVSIKHSLTKDKCRTALGVRGVPSGSANTWWQRAATWGIGSKNNDLPGQTPTPNATASVLGGIHIGGASNAPGTIGQIPNPTVADWLETELHVSTSSGFTPSAATFVAKGRQTDFYVHGLLVGTTYYVKLINVDRKRNRSQPSAQVAVVPRAATVNEMLVSLQSAFDAYLNTAAVPPGVTGAIVPYDTDNWDNLSEFNVATHKFVASHAGKYSFTAQVRVDGLTSSFSGASASLSLHVNGAAASSVNGIAVSPVDTIPHVPTKSMMNPLVTGSIDLLAGDQVEVRLDYSLAGMFAGTAFTTGKADCKFLGSKVSTR